MFCHWVLIYLFLLCGVGVNSDLHHPMGLHHPQLVPPPQIPITQPVSAMMPLTQEHLINGRVLEQLAPINESNGMSNNVSAHSLQKQQSIQQQRQHQQHQSAIHAELANLSQPNTPAAPGNASHIGTPYTSPAPTPTPMHMQADPAPQMSHGQQSQDPNLQRTHLALLTSHLQNTSLDLSHHQPQRSPIMNGCHDATPRGTPHHTPIPSPTPGNFSTPAQQPPNLPDQYQLQLIPEAQFKQEVM